MVSKLEDKIYLQKTHCPPVIDFKKNDHQKGLEFIDAIRKAIVAKKTLCLTSVFQSTKSQDAHNENYKENRIIDLSTYYNNVKGVNKSPRQRDCEVVFWIDNANAPYVITKPLHYTQNC